MKKFIKGELKKADDDGQVDGYDDVGITFQQWTTSDCPHKKISEILPSHSGIIVVLSNN